MSRNIPSRRAPSSPSPGRPRAFDPDHALDRALKVFWRKGYEGATLPELTAAMRINRPSLYATFGNKEQLFRRAIDRYLDGPACHVAQALDQPTARAVAEHLWRGTVDLVTHRGNPRGCFMVQGALACGEEGEPLRREMNKRRAAAETALAARFTRATESGDLPADVQPRALARYVAAINFGISVQAAGGATRAQLLGVVEVALRAWPTRSLNTSSG